MANEWHEWNGHIKGQDDETLFKIVNATDFEVAIAERAPELLEMTKQLRDELRRVYKFYPGTNETSPQFINSASILLDEIGKPADYDRLTERQS